MKLSKMLWLREEMLKWVEHGWLSREGMNQILTSYGQFSQAKYPSLTRLMFVGLGILLLGLGLFLIMAGYWYSFSPNGRFDLILGLVILLLLLVGVTRWQTTEGTYIREAVGVIFFIGIVVSILAVSDTYYLGDSIGISAALVALISLIGAYFLQSSFLMGLFLLTSAYWSSTDRALSFYGGPHFVYLALLAAIPLYRKILLMEGRWTQRKIFLSWSYVIAIYLACFFTFTNEAGPLMIIVLTNLAVITFSLGRLSNASGFWTLPFRSIGLLGLLYVVYLGTFMGTWQYIKDLVFISTVDQIITIASLLGTFYLTYRMIMKKYYLSALVGSSGLVVALCALAAKMNGSPIAITVIFNLFVFLVATMFIIRGTAFKNINLVNGGALTIIVIVLARFFDPGFTFVERGISFIIVGLLLLIANSLYMINKTRKMKEFNASVRQAKKHNRRALHTMETAVSEQRLDVSPSRQKKNEDVRHCDTPAAGGESHET